MSFVLNRAVINPSRFMYPMNTMHIDRRLDLTQIRLLAELSHSASVSRAAQRAGIVFENFPWL